MHIPQVLRPRIVAEHNGQVAVALEDDRIARTLVLSLGTLAVGTLGAGFTVGGPLWPWVGLGSVPVLSLIAMGLAATVGRRTVLLILDPRTLWLAERSLELGQIQGVRLEEEMLWLDTSPEPTRICLSGEEEVVREAVVDWLRARIEEARA
ncbi:MAG TPA: hypothetical protein ENK18_21005 [Deltaproteobacteria bacterium]|nr:hypothetical protein [Deltaproteobacteria bacterium]